MSSVGAKLDAQISTPDPLGATAGRRTERSDHRPRTRRIQDVHIPWMRVHSRHSLPKSTREYLNSSSNDREINKLVIKSFVCRLLVQSFDFKNRSESQTFEIAPRCRLTIDEFYYSLTNCITLKGMSSLNKGRWHIIFCLSDGHTRASLSTDGQRGWRVLDGDD